MKHVIVVGAGPAGLAAAGAAQRAGAQVTVVDAAEETGGQYHRPGFGRHLLDRCEWLPESAVWSLERRDAGPPLVHLLRGTPDGSDRRRATLDPDALVLATGAHDRVLPFPGWTLPGVYTAGAAQRLAKREGLAVGRTVILSGTGPFLLPVAASLTSAGARVRAVLEANRLGTVARGWAAGALPPRKVGELLGYAAGQVRHRVPYLTGRAVVEARGEDRVTEVVVARLAPDWSAVPGTERVYEADAVCVGHGFTARLELPVAAGCALTPGGDAVAVDADQRTTADGVLAAGEITGIAGAVAAADDGAVAGWIAAGGPPHRIPRDRRRRDRGRAFGARLGRAHPVGPGWTTWLRPDTVICRCEAVDHATLARALADRAGAGARAVRLGTRAGLGPCQARICGPTLATLAAAAGAEAPSVHNRPIAEPVRLAELRGDSP